MRFLLQLLLVFTLALFGNMSEVMACCADKNVKSNTHCESDTADTDQHEMPCDSSCCDDCICYVPIPVICLYQVKADPPPKITFTSRSYTYRSLFEHLFADIIWQPPRWI